MGLPQAPEPEQRAERSITSPMSRPESSHPRNPVTHNGCGPKEGADEAAWRPSVRAARGDRADGFREGKSVIWGSLPGVNSFSVDAQLRGVRDVAAMSGYPRIFDRRRQRGTLAIKPEAISLVLWMLLLPTSSLAAGITWTGGGNLSPLAAATCSTTPTFAAALSQRGPRADENSLILRFFSERKCYELGTGSARLGS